MSKEKFTARSVNEAVHELHEKYPVVTTNDVAKAIGCQPETARIKLNELTAEGTLTARKVGARAKVWYSADQTWDTSQKSEDESATRQSSKERVLFFPSRREIVLDSPTDRSKRILAQTAHLVDSTGDGYLYRLDAEDMWNSPYEEFGSLKSDLAELVGSSWEKGFESRIRDDWERAHQFKIRTHSEGYSVLQATKPETFENVAKQGLEYGEHYTEFLSEKELRITNGAEGAVKETLYDEGYPAVDVRRLSEGSSLDISLRQNIKLRGYQQEWVNKFAERRSGVFVGPSGSGKTVAALGAMEAISGETLIIVPSRELVQQWKEELVQKTTLASHNIGEYHGGTKQVRPVTVATYDIAAMSRHRELFNERDWAFVIADECHHSVASTWRRFREIQSKARLGLSATPIREADNSKQIYTLIGPPIGADWGRLFAEEWVRKPDVRIVSVPWEDNKTRERYQRASGAKRLIEAARNPRKIEVIESILAQHHEQKTIIFIDWIKQGRQLSEELNVPFIYGETDHAKRDSVYNQFRRGSTETLVVSRIGDEGIDLPDAEVAILASTRGASRSQTGQRAGRTMRPLGSSTVYMLLTKGSGEEEWGRESTQYLAEKGISVTRTDWDTS